ncbi:TonB-dependent receptor [Stenotrophomonas sp. S41]|nr:TonB-dependent receptor [Stenotrophomonas sp. S41]
MVTRSSFIGIDYTLDHVGNRFDATLRQPIGVFDNTLTAGFDVNRLKYDKTRGDSATAQALNPYDFLPGNFPTTVTVGELFTTRTDTQSIFAEDQFKISPKLSLIGGLRWDRMSYIKQDSKGVAADVEKVFTHTSGRLGAVYALSPAASLYAQYSTAVDPLAGIVNTTAQQSQLDLSTGQQAEMGWKQLFDQGKGEFTLAAYWIRKKKLLSRDALNPDLYQQVGAQSSRGIEASFSYTPTSALRVDINGAVLDAHFDEFREVAAGQVVSRAGLTPPGVPERMANAWVTWSFWPRWEAGLGVRYVGPRQVDNANASRVGSFTVADASLRWAVRAGTTLSLHAYNLTDRVYAQTLYNSNNQWILGRPRSIEVSALIWF